jgi:hypothetical protein
MTTAQQVAMVVFSGGGAAAIYTLAKAWLALRADADTREATAIAMVEKWRQQAEERADRLAVELEAAHDMKSYWRSRAGRLEHLLATNGIAIPDHDRRDL